MKKFEKHQYNVFGPDVKKGGAGQVRFLCIRWQVMALGGMQSSRRKWAWSPTWSEIMGVGGFNLSAGNPGAHAKPKPKTPSQPALGGGGAAGPPQPPGRLHQGHGGHPRHPRQARNGMLCVF